VGKDTGAGIRAEGDTVIEVAGENCTFAGHARGLAMFSTLNSRPLLVGLAAGLSVAVMLASTSAWATVQLLAIYSDSVYHQKWVQSSNPTPDYSDPVVTYVPISEAAGNLIPVEVTDLDYYTNADGGGFSFILGPQIFTGPTSAPVFSVGTFTGLHTPYSSGGVLTLTVLSETAVPEPSTWAMMLLGFAGLGFAGYRQRRRAKLLAA
jgi:hypothetical protein